MPEPEHTRRHGPVRLAEVAKAAGVAVSTVSRALANPDRVSLETRERVIDTARKLGYSTNVAARSLRLGRSGMLMVILSAMPGKAISPVLGDVLRGMYDEAGSLGYGLIVKMVDRTARLEPHLLDLAHGGMVDGVITVSDLVLDDAGRSLMESNIPVVALLIDLTNLGWPSVVSNDRTGIAAITRHLVELGHRRFMFVSGPKGSYHDDERYGGFKDALTEARLLSGHKRIPDGNFDPPSGVAAAHKFLGLRVRPTAVVCCNDGMAIGFMDTVHRAGLRIPQDVAVTGYDDLEFSEYATPGLTTVRQPSAEIGKQGVRTVVAISEGRLPSTSRLQIVENDIVVRGTTVPLVQKRIDS